MTSEILALTIPKWGLSMTEGTLASWRVAVGETVDPGDVIAEIETSKIVNELESQTAGTLRRQVASEGETLPVGALIGIVAGESVPDADIDAFLTRFDPDGDAGQTPSAPQPDAESGSADDKTSSAQRPAKTTTEHIQTSTSIPDLLKATDGDKADVLATHHARKLAEALEIDLGKVTGTGRRNRISKGDLIAAIEDAGGSFGGQSTGGKTAASPVDGGSADVRATPLARRLATLLDVDLATVTPTGVRGRVTKADVQAAADEGRVSATEVHRSETPIVPNEESVAIPMSGMRKVIASRLSESKRTAPHFRLSIELELDNLLSLRKDLNESDEIRISLNDLLVKAAASALIAVPSVNIQFDGETIHQFQNAHIAVAVALDEGLVTPVVRSANEKGLAAIATEIRDLAGRAREGGLSPDEFEGGTFTISNLGMFGISQFDAIINPPQGAILAVGSSSRVQVFDADDTPRMITRMTVTLSSDHRVIDGATGAKFLAAFREFVETPGRMLI